MVELVDELVEGDAIEREPLGIGLDADLVRAAADNVGRADIVDLGEFVLQFLGDLEEAVVGPARGLSGCGRQGQRDDGDVVDAAADDQRLGDALGQIADIGADLLVDPQASRCPRSVPTKKRAVTTTLSSSWSANRHARRR